MVQERKELIRVRVHCGLKDFLFCEPLTSPFKPLHIF